MLVLVNASLTPDAMRALEREWSWKLRPVKQVRMAVSQMPEHDRLSVRALIIEAEPVDRILMSQLARLELIACLRSDPVNVDIAAATERGIPVVHTPGRNAEAVADFTLGLCLAAVRNIAVTHHLIVAGDLSGAPATRGAGIAPGDTIWRPADPDIPIPYVAYQGRHLSSLIVGVIGYGAVGRTVGQRFAGLVRAVHVSDPAVPAEVVNADGLIPASLPELLQAADVVTIHARSKTVIIGRDELQQMKPGSILINTARATVLDYGALAESLDSGHLSAAALDVYPEEPLPASSPLRHQRGLTLTPHLAGAAAEVTDRQSEILLETVRRLYGGFTWEDLPIRNRELRHRWTILHPAADRCGGDEGEVARLEGA